MANRISCKLYFFEMEPQPQIPFRIVHSDHRSPQIFLLVHGADEFATERADIGFLTQFSKIVIHEHRHLSRAENVLFVASVLTRRSLSKSTVCICASGSFLLWSIQKQPLSLRQRSLLAGDVLNPNLNKHDIPSQRTELRCSACRCGEATPMGR